MQEDNNEESEKVVKKKLQVDIPEEVEEGIYSNMAVISHSSTEFVVDFLRIMPNVPKAKVKARVILTPEHAKRLLLALQDNLEKFEAQHSETTSKNNDFNPPFPINLSGTGEA